MLSMLLSTMHATTLWLNCCRRGIDGRVWLKGSKGEYAVRLDMEVPGAMLFRDGSGYVYALQTEALQQIDLSNDSVVSGRCMAVRRLSMRA